MCGISGAVFRNAGQMHREEFARFNGSLRHRGPDSSMVYPLGNIWLGHNRLSIIDKNSSANQPLRVEHGGRYFYIIFNGEIYNYIELKDELKSIGYGFKTNSDTEVALKAYIEWGDQCQYKFNGMWAMAILDPFSGDLFISRDRFGVKPLYFFFRGDSCIFFASELKAFSHLPPRFRLECDRNVLRILSQRPNNESKIDGPVCALPAGHSVTIRKDLKFTLKRWWKTSNWLIDLNGKSDEDLIENFTSIFFSALKLRTRSDASVCSALSGGLDSSSVVSALASINSNWKDNGYKAFIFEYKSMEHIESSYGFDVCNKHNVSYSLCSHDLKSLGITEDIVIDCIYASEQLANLQIGPYLLYKSMSDQGYKVSIDGHGADEILGGYPCFRISSLIDAYHDGGRDLFREVAASWSDDEGVYPGDIDQNLLDVQNLVDSNTSLLCGNSFKEHRLKQFDQETLPWILDTYDKLPMRHNVEVRSPFLDWRLVVFSLSLPNHILVKNGFTKYILRRSLKSLLPRSVQERRSKLGFLPKKEFFLKIEPVMNVMRFTVESKAFLESSHFDGHACRKLFNQSLMNNNLSSLYKIWPLVQATIFKEQWCK